MSSLRSWKEVGIREYHLGVARYSQQKYGVAEQLLQHVVQQQERVLGVEHKDTLNSKQLLAMTLYHLEEYHKAKQLLQQVVPQRESLLGVEHRTTLDCKFWLARTLYHLEEYHKAKQLLQQVVPQRESLLGVEHKTTLDCKFWLARTLYRLEEYHKAKQLLQQVVPEQERLLGVENNKTVRSRGLLQKVLSAISPPSSINTTAETVASRLGNFFEEVQGTQTPYTDSDINQISLLLKQANPKWSKVPRTYIVLRTIGSLNLLDNFLDLGFSDHWFPVTERSLPHCLQPSHRSEFVAAQNLVMTKSVALEKGDAGQHCHFGRNEPLPFEQKRILGSGAFGQVDKVVSSISFREYALKRVPRTTVFGGRRAADVKSFIAEIEILKRLKHRHVVQFVGSYTDPKYMGLLMHPVAEMDFSSYLKGADASKHREMRTFFGCLARALEFLHEQKVRHKDIKPSNILVHHGKVLFTDFGLSLDFTDATGSTTVSMVNGMTPRYCAPEVSMFQPRNTSSDIWSLGVVFLEMIVVLKGRTVEDMYEYFKEHGVRQPFIRENHTALVELAAELRGTASLDDNVALIWVQDMLVRDPNLRPTAASLVASITAAASQGRDGNGAFCGICCVSREDDFSDEFDELDDGLDELYLGTD